MNISSRLAWALGWRKVARRPALHLGNFEGNCEEIVGESHYQAVLEQLAGGRPENGRDCHVEVIAVLIHEDDNPADSMAVRIEIAGQCIGYLTRANARLYRSWLASGGHAGRRTTCAARIIGGWDRGSGSRGYFGVELDIPSFYGPPP